MQIDELFAEEEDETEDFSSKESIVTKVIIFMVFSVLYNVFLHIMTKNHVVFYQSGIGFISLLLECHSTSWILHAPIASCAVYKNIKNAKTALTDRI